MCNAICPSFFEGGIINTVKHLLFARTLFSDHRDAKIKSSSIIYHERIIEQKRTIRESKVSGIYSGWWPRENKVTGKISVLQYVIGLPTYRPTVIPTDMCNAICPSFFEGGHKYVIGLVLLNCHEKFRDDTISRFRENDF